jgi:hypothetical protein
MLVAKTPETSPPVDDVLAVENHGIIGMMWNMVPLELLQSNVEGFIVPPAKPASQKTQIAMARLVQVLEHVVP